MKINEITEELIKIKETQITIIEVLENFSKLLKDQNDFLRRKENARRKYLEKELNKKWWQF